MTRDEAGAVEATLVLGTRPEIIKLAPVVEELQRRDVEFSIVHTGQHYSERLDAVFFDQLDLPQPDHELGIGSGSQGRQTGEMIVGVEEVLLAERPETVIVQGDTNSTLAGSIAGAKLDVDLAHVEAGLRSYDRTMPEELNRVLADHASDLLFAPTETAKRQLLDEGIPEERVHVTGNTIVDAVRRHRELAMERSHVLDDLGLAPGEYGLMTAHRQENVDDVDRFADVLEGVGSFAAAAELEVIYPIHPRSSKRIEEFDLAVPDRIRLVEPLDFFDFLELEANARIAFTDSGGVQEEACILGVPCVTLRENTERPETIEVGANRLVGTRPEAIVAGGEEMDDAERGWENPYGDGTAAERIVRTLLDFATDAPSSGV